MQTADQLWALPPEQVQHILSELAQNQSGAAALAPAQPQSKGYSVSGGVAVIPIHGAITRTTIYSSYSGQPLSLGQDRILAALADGSVRAILLDVNSPGGAVPGAKELADRVAEAAKEKPMAAYANGLMASAAMWIAAATGRVLAPVTATVGSVGVIWVHADWSRLNEKMGLSYSYITGGKWKAAGNPDHPLGEEERELFQRQVSQIHGIFKADVIRGLGLTAPESQWAEGQTMLAADASEQARGIARFATTVEHAAGTRDLAATPQGVKSGIVEPALAAFASSTVTPAVNEAKAEGREARETAQEVAEALVAHAAHVVPNSGEATHLRMHYSTAAPIGKGEEGELWFQII